MKKTLRILSIALTAIMCVSMAFIASPKAAGAYDSTKAEKLSSLGLLKGSGDGYDLERAATRNEAAVMLIRLMGKENKAKAQYNAGNLICPFSDVPEWAAAQVAWLYENNYVNGADSSTYGGSATITAQQYAALVLRSLGYSEANGDYTYANALNFAANAGILSGEEKMQYTSSFLRGDLIGMSYNVLYLKMNNSKRTLYTKLSNDGVFDTLTTAAASEAAVSLSLKYQGGGSDTKWYVEPATGCSPVCTDIDGDGKLEIFYSGLSVFCLDAKTGGTKWRVHTGTDRNDNQTTTKAFGYTGTSMYVLDIDADGKKEIIVAHSNGAYATGCLSVYDSNGYFKSGWPKKLKAPVNALTVADLDGDGRYEICIGLGTGDTSDSVYVYEPDGSIRQGWPRPCGNSLYSNAIETVDLDGDGTLEIVALNDTEHVSAYKQNGAAVLATDSAYSGLKWTGLPLCEDYTFELKCAAWAKTHGGEAWATSDSIIGKYREERDCFMGTIGGIAADDLDGDGKKELAITGMITDGSKVMREDVTSFTSSARYFTTFILDLDRGRYVNKTNNFDWTEVPTDTGTPLVMNTYILNYTNCDPAIADADGDGNKEIIYAACDGKVHCFNLDGTEHGAWPFSLVTRSDSISEYASAPVCVDINGDGKMEIIFSTFTQSNQLEERGKLFVLNSNGKVLGSTTIPTKWGDGDYAPNGSMASPLVADIDGDGAYEIALTSQYSGLMVYDLRVG
jgi:hypothetical protein